MRKINQKDIDNRLTKAIRELSDPKSYDLVCHEHRLGEPMPSIEKLAKMVDKIRQIIFPGYFGDINLNLGTIEYYIGVMIDEVFELISEQILAGLCFSCSDTERPEMLQLEKNASQIAMEFIEGLPEIRRIMVTDVNAAYLGDPAANGIGEVIFCYPATRAISNYRIAHHLLKLGVPLIPRIITEMAHSETGIDIHPRAEIGEYFSIDHGTGVVIGSTSVIGKNVKLYQGVTLGAKSFPLDENGNPIKGIPRHPIVEDNVVVYSNATVLGRITIGHDSVIGGNVWVTNSLPPHSKVVQVKSRQAEFVDGSGI